MKKTSAVPLKKETVRVTLKSTDAEAPKASGPPKAPSAPKPPAPAPTIPLKTAGAKPPGAPRAPAPAPTVQLKTPGAPRAPKTSPLKTQPIETPGSPTAALPKATVQLGKATQALGAPTALSQTQVGLQTAYEEEEEEAPDKTVIALSVVGFVAAIVVMAFQAMATTAWDGWGVLFD
jgi:hypothetical protein